MALHFRLLITLFFALLKPRRKKLEETEIAFRVLPTDCHLPYFRLMCAGRYFDFMDLARVDQVTQWGLLRTLYLEGLSMVVAGQYLKYLRPLKVFQRFNVKTRILFWDDRFVYIEHRFEQAGVLKTVGIVQGCLLGRKGIANPREILSRHLEEVPPPPMPPEVRDWHQLTDRASGKRR